MVFSSLIFLYVFLPVCLGIYFLTKDVRKKNIVLLAASLLFYAWGEPVWIVLLLFSSTMNFVMGWLIDQAKDTPKAKKYLIASIVMNLALLGIFKYTGLFVSTINGITGIHIPVPAITLPIGISFYTFQAMSYTIDVYWGKVGVQRSLLNFVLYVSLFPQLIAGPIVRYSEIEHQLSERKTTVNGFSQGILRFLCGLSKKVLIANFAGKICTSLIGSLEGATFLGVWMGIIFFAVQIYFDFSGYSDMAIGLGKIFGFTYGENFNHPYISTSITEFWRRWHISLSSFFRDYVYIPLGGNRKFQLRNILIVWLLTGLWHGASWNFVLWGVYYGIVLVIEKYLLKKVLEKLPKAVSWLYSIIVIVIGWALFYFTDFASLSTAFSVMFGSMHAPLYDPKTLLIVTNNLSFLLIAALAATPLGTYLAGRLKLKNEKAYSILSVVYTVLMLLVSTAALVGESYNPFLYFRF